MDSPDVAYRPPGRQPPGSSRSGSHASYPQSMAYMGNTLSDHPCPTPTRATAQLNEGFRSGPSSVEPAHDPIARKLPLELARDGEPVECRQQHDLDPVIASNSVVERPESLRVAIGVGLVDDPPAPEHVVDQQHATRADPGDQLLPVCLLYTSPSPRDRTRSR